MPSMARITNNTSNIMVTTGGIATSTQVTLELQTDNYGSETRWKLFKPDGTVQAQAGPFGNGAGQAVKTYNWNLQDMSCYRLEFYDVGGDGICCSYGQGWYKVTSNGQTIVQGGTFTNVDVKNFSINTSLVGISTNELEHSLNVYPNPTTGLLNLEYSLDQGARVNVVISDVVGKVVLERTLEPASGTQRQTLDLNSLSNGIYILKMGAGDHQATRTITLNK